VGDSAITFSFFFKGNALCSAVCGAYLDGFLQRGAHFCHSWDIAPVIGSDQLKPARPALQ
jgi:hypothetical protein